MINNLLTIFSLSEGCYSPNVILIPLGSTLLSPISFRRSQDFSIISIIDFNCNDSLLITTRWSIYNCSTTCSDQILVDQTIKTTFSELYIPARTLPYGIYELKLNVTIVDFTSLTTSSSVYVRTTRTGITPNLVQLGTSMITSGYEQDLLLDPGSFSIDPDENNFNRSVSNRTIMIDLKSLH